MRDPRQDLGLNVLLDVGPRLAVLGRLAREQLPEVAGLDGRHHRSVAQGAIVLDNWMVVVSLARFSDGQGGRRHLLSSTDATAASLKVSESMIAAGAIVHNAWFLLLSGAGDQAPVQSFEAADLAPCSNR